MAIYIIGLLENGKEKMVRLYNDKKNQYRDMNEKDVLFMLDEETIKIKNAEIKENKLVGSTGSLKKITNQNVYTVVGYIGDVDKKPLAYKFVDSNGKVYIVKIVDCIDFFNRNLVQNASIVENKYIRGINWTIPCVEQKKEAEQKKEVEQKEEEKIIPFEITAKNASYFIEKYLKNDILDIPSNFERDGKKYCITSIGANAFCSLKPNVIGVKFPDSVEKIDKQIFEFGDNSIEYLYLGKNVKNIITNAFGGTQYLEKIEVSPNNPYYCSKDDVLFTKDMKKLVKYPRFKSDISYKVPDEVEVILEEAFDTVDRLLKIDLGKGLREIEKCAFWNAGSLSDIIIYKNLKKIGSDSLNVHQVEWSDEEDPEKIEKLHIHYEGSKEDWSNVYRADYWTDFLEIEKGKRKYWYDIVYDNKESLENIGAIPFEGYYSYFTDNFLKDGILDIPSVFEKDGKTYYLDEIEACAFEHIDIKQINLGWTLKSISSINFYNTNLEAINIHSYNPYYCSKDGVLFTKDMKKLVKYPERKPDISYKVPDEVEVILDSAFCRASRLLKIDLGKGLREIERDGLEDVCSTLDIIIHKNLKKIGSGGLDMHQVVASAEKDPEKIEKLHIHYEGSKEDWSEVYKANNWTDLMNLGNDKRKYWYDIVYNYTGTLDSIGPIPFDIYKEDFSYLINNFLKDGILDIPSIFEKDGKSYYLDKIDENFFESIPVKQINLGWTLENIDVHSFFYADLEAINIDDYNPYYCSKDGVLFTKDMKKLVKYPNIKPDVSYKVPDSVEIIGDCAFEKAWKLRKIDLGKGVKEIGADVFNVADNVYDFIIHKNLKKICSGGLNVHQVEWSNLHNKEVAEKIHIYYEGSKEDWSNTHKVDYWTDKKWLEDGKNVYWYDIVYDYKGSLDSISSTGFTPFTITADNSNYFIEHFLKDGILNIPSNFKKDGKKYTVVAINAGAFYGIDTNVIKCIKIPDSVTELGNAFNCYRGVKYIYFGKNVKNLETLFKWNSDEEPLWWKLEKIKVSPENPYYCSENGILFTKDMKTLIKYPTSKKGQSYKVPEMVEKIAPYAFYKHSCLRSIDLGKSLIEIGPSAFEMGSVCRFKVPKTLKFIDVDAFQNQFAFDTPEELTKNKIVFYYEGSQEDWIKIEKADSWIDNYTQNWIIKETAYTELYHKVHYNYKKE